MSREFHRYDINRTEIAELRDSGVVIRDVSDALELLAMAGARTLAIRADQIVPAFFSLRSGALDPRKP